MEGLTLTTGLYSGFSFFGCVVSFFAGRSFFGAWAGLAETSSSGSKLNFTTFCNTPGQVGLSGFQYRDLVRILKGMQLQPSFRYKPVASVATVYTWLRCTACLPRSSAEQRLLRRKQSQCREVLRRRTFAVLKNVETSAAKAKQGSTQHGRYLVWRGRFDGEVSNFAGVTFFTKWRRHTESDSASIVFNCLITARLYVYSVAATS